jgi:hypothetical protein
MQGKRSVQQFRNSATDGQTYSITPEFGDKLADVFEENDHNKNGENSVCLLQAA